MRKTGACAAVVLLALVLGTAGCDLVSSLTPFGIGRKDYSGTTEGFNGNWAGSTSSGGAFSFTVASGKVLNIDFRHNTADCYTTFHLTAREVRIANDTFLYENNLSSQGSIRVSGNFTSSTTCVGSYSFEGREATTCKNLTFGGGSFTATKTP